MYASNNVCGCVSWYSFKFIFQLFESAHNSPPLCKSSSLNSPDVLTQQPLSLNAITSSGIPSVHVAALSGITEVKMKMKQNEAVAGPKV